MNEKTASQVRYEQARARLARETFYQHPQSEPAAIAKHYAAHAILAMNLLELLALREHGGPSADLDMMILDLTKVIKANHLYDFGLKLEWHPNSEKP